MKGKARIATTIISIFVVSLAGIFVWSIMGSRAEQTKYQLMYATGDIEIREYPPLVIAQVAISGERKDAITKGFKILADYIFGNNTSRTKIAMTAPVTQQSREKLAMTAPVTQAYVKGEWQVRFIMPSEYNLQTLPIPNNPAIKIEKIPSKEFVVIRFSGIPSDTLLAEKLEKLKEFIRT